MRGPSGMVSLTTIAVLHLSFWISPSSAMIDKALPNCAKPGLDMGTKSGVAIGGLGAAAYSALMSTCPALIPHITSAAAVGSAATVSMPGLILGGPLAPVAAMVTAGMLGGAMIGGAAGSMISCREIGVQNDSHVLIQYKELRHPGGFVVELGDNGSYKPKPGFNHHVHPSSDMGEFDYDDMDYFMLDKLPEKVVLPSVARSPFFDYAYQKYLRKGPIYPPGFVWQEYPEALVASKKRPESHKKPKDHPPLFYNSMPKTKETGHHRNHSMSVDNVTAAMAEDGFVPIPNPEQVNKSVINLPTMHMTPTRPSEEDEIMKAVMQMREEDMMLNAFLNRDSNHFPFSHDNQNDVDSNDLLDTLDQDELMTRSFLHDRQPVMLTPSYPHRYHDFLLDNRLIHPDFIRHDRSQLWRRPSLDRHFSSMDRWQRLRNYHQNFDKSLSYRRPEVKRQHEIYKQTLPPFKEFKTKDMIEANHFRPFYGQRRTLNVERQDSQAPSVDDLLRQKIQRIKTYMAGTPPKLFRRKLVKAKKHPRGGRRFDSGDNPWVYVDEKKIKKLRELRQKASLPFRPSVRIPMPDEVDGDVASKALPVDTTESQESGDVPKDMGVLETLPPDDNRLENKKSEKYSKSSGRDSVVR